jgi:broad specificity phosphatase PhoE
MWVNRYWKDIGDDPARQHYYTKPHEARPPGGETLNEVQQRAVPEVQDALAENLSGPLLFVTHGDVIRAIVAHYLDIDIITLRHARINNASVTALEVTADGANLLCLNHTAGLVGLP